LEDLGVDGRMILKWIFETWDGVWVRLSLTLNKDKWPAVVNAVMNTRIPLSARNFVAS